MINNSFYKNQSFFNYNNNELTNDIKNFYKGQPLVHIVYGIGRYDGMNLLEINGITKEYLVLLYANNDKLYVPVSSLQLINPYHCLADTKAPLHKLGNNSWSKTKQKATKIIKDIATELLNISAKREIKDNSYIFNVNKNKLNNFCKQFKYQLTIDQKKAINDVIKDMCSPIIMDRLVCGDVGFGKTEVAIRAAFIATDNNKQVAILVPTTLLAQQHFENFKKRFFNWPINIELISRLRNNKDQKKILEQTAKGKIHILIGTHKLLQNNLKWFNLGLLIIDEEHKFGVHHKEKIKKIKININVLTLTATPIPRTLNMAISGIKNFSIITTPPANRIAVKTIVMEYNSLVIRKAILKEILRDGLVYYIYNDIKNIENIFLRLKKLVPEANIIIGHGKMYKIHLKKIINDFNHKRFNVLLCTTIIETGIDIANANTIIIENADYLGLAQLYQLRGRVGRSHHQAYAYLLTSPKKKLNQNTKKRLKAIISTKELGSGFSLATYDLEIRGAGELLGKNQSGQIEEIGLSLYLKLLNNTITALKNGTEPLFDDITSNFTEINLSISAFLPKNYISDINIRLLTYKRISQINNFNDINIIKNKLINNYGKLPNPVKFLLKIAIIRFRANSLGIKKIESNLKQGLIEFNKINYIDSFYIANLLQKNELEFKLNNKNQLQFNCNLSNDIDLINYLINLINNLEQKKL